MTRLIGQTKTQMRKQETIKLIFIIFIISLLITVIGLTFGSEASTKNKPLYWKQVDDAGELYKLCDRGNLIYFSGKNQNGKSIFVIEGGCR